MAFTPNNFPAAIAEVKRLVAEVKDLRQKLAELQKKDGEAVKRGRSKNQDKESQS